MRIFFAVTLALLSLPLSAATDMALEMSVISQVTGQPVTRVPLHTPVVFGVRYFRFGEPPAGPVTFEIDVPGTVGEVHPLDENVVCNGTRPVHCVAREAPWNVASIVDVEAQMTTAGTLTATARIVSPSDENPSNNTVSATIDVVDKPSLVIDASFGRRRLEPGQQSQFVLQFGNSGADATNVVATATLTNGGRITSVEPRSLPTPAECTYTETSVRCVAASLPYEGDAAFDVGFVAPESLEGGVFRVEAHVTSAQGDFDEANNVALLEATMVRHLLVTTTDDEGAGSLRQALLDAAVLCAFDPCTVDFRIPGPGPFVIRPRTQLPDVRGVVKIDGATQTAFGGNTNVGGPEVEIDGSLQLEGNGLVLREGCELQVLDLEMYGFPNSAIELRRGTVHADACGARFETLFPETRIARNELRNNNRGIVVMDSGLATIEDNVLRDNFRSGLFAQRTFYLAIRRNRMSHNGASGMFLDIGSREYVAGGADVEENVIAHNAHWGIARTNSGEISILRNSIYDNAYQGIDVNLDFDTPNVPDDSGRPPNKPVLFSAVYDAAANETVVRGSIASRNPAGAYFTLEIFASDTLSKWGQPQGETRVWTSTLPNGSPDGPGNFEVRVLRDLRGKFVTATITRVHIIGFAKPPKVSSESHLFSVPADTSEFSDAVKGQ